MSERESMETPFGTVSRYQGGMVMEQFHMLFVALAANIDDEQKRNTCIDKFVDFFDEAATAIGGERKAPREQCIAGKIKEIKEQIDQVRSIYRAVEKAANSTNN